MAANTLDVTISDKTGDATKCTVVYKVGSAAPTSGKFYSVMLSMGTAFATTTPVLATNISPTAATYATGDTITVGHGMAGGATSQFALTSGTAITGGAVSAVSATGYTITFDVLAADLYKWGVSHRLTDKAHFKYFAGETATAGYEIAQKGTPAPDGTLSAFANTCANIGKAAPTITLSHAPVKKLNAGNTAVETTGDDATDACKFTFAIKHLVAATAADVCVAWVQKDQTAFKASTESSLGAQYTIGATGTAKVTGVVAGQGKTAAAVTGDMTAATAWAAGTFLATDANQVAATSFTEQTVTIEYINKDNMQYIMDSTTKAWASIKCAAAASRTWKSGLDTTSLPYTVAAAAAASLTCTAAPKPATTTAASDAMTSTATATIAALGLLW